MSNYGRGLPSTLKKEMYPKKTTIGQTGRWMYRQIDDQTRRQTDRQMDRRTDRHIKEVAYWLCNTYRSTYVYRSYANKNKQYKLNK